MTLTVLEQLLSPLVVVTGPLQRSLIEPSSSLISRGHAHRYPDGAVPQLRADLEAARDASPLPSTAEPEAVDALHNLIAKARLS